MATCPVCGYKRLLYPVEENPICPSCYTEFGYDDTMKTITQLRQDWVNAGMPWGAANVTPQPADWNPTGQLQDLLKDKGRAAIRTLIAAVSDEKETK